MRRHALVDDADHKLQPLEPPEYACLHPFCIRPLAQGLRDEG